MGWTGIPGAAKFCKTAKQRLEFLKEELNLDGHSRIDGEGNSRVTTLLQSTNNGTGEFFLIIENAKTLHDDQGTAHTTKNVMCLVVLVEAQKDGSLCYKEMTEYCCPYYYPNSQSFLLKLERLNPIPPMSAFTGDTGYTAEGFYSRKWRDTAFRLAMKRKTLNMVREGGTVWVRLHRETTVSGVPVHECIATRVNGRLLFRHPTGGFLFNLNRAFTEQLEFIKSPTELST